MYKSTTKQTAFTIVELLIVIVVIGILAAITIVAYNGIQNRARASAASGALSQAAKKLAVYQVDNSAYPSSLTAAGVTDSSDVSYQYKLTSSGYCITATAGTVSYKITESSSPASGSCAGHGAGGVAAITNIATNPSNETNDNQWSARWFGNNGGAGTVSHSSAAARCGSLGYRKTWTSSGGGGQDIGYTYEQPTFVAGRTYAFNTAMRSSYNTTGRAWVDWYNASSQQISSSNFGTEYPSSPGTWTNLSFTATAPVGTVRGYFIFGPYPFSGAGMTVGAGSTLDFDCVLIAESSSNQNYGDGSSANWDWNGTAHASTSSGSPL